MDDKKPKTERLGFRADQELATRVDDLINAMDDSPRLKGLDANMTVVLKMLVRRALPLAELEYIGFVPGMTADEEGEFLLSELRTLLARADSHPGIATTELLEVLDQRLEMVHSALKLPGAAERGSGDPDEIESREARKRRVLERREKKRS